MVRFELARDEFNRLILEIFVAEDQQPPVLLDDPTIHETLRQCVLIRAINDRTGDLIAEFAKVERW